MSDARLTNYDTAMAHLKGAETDGPQISDDAIVPTVQYDLAAAQVRAMLAVADELKALRKAVESVDMAIGNLDSEHSNLRWIQTWLKDIAERPVG